MIDYNYCAITCIGLNCCYYETLFSFFMFILAVIHMSDSPDPTHVTPPVHPEVPENELYLPTELYKQVQMITNCTIE